MASKIFRFGQFILSVSIFLYRKSNNYAGDFIGLHFLILVPLDVNLMEASCSPMDADKCKVYNRAWAFR
jgi:hypothetical protein